MVIASAPGKIHLIGEHAVVYGEPAIIAAIGMRTYVKIENSKNINYTDLTWPDISHSWTFKEVFEITQRTTKLWQAGNKKKDFSELFNFIKRKKYEGYRAAILGIAMKMFGIDKGFSIKVDSKIPTGAGLGSSASRAIAITKAIGEFFKKKISLEKINEIAFEQEKIIHGIPSGGDNTACCFGGLIWFKKAKPKNEIKFLKKEVPYKLKNFVLVYTKKPGKTTGELVQMVRQLNKKYRDKRIKEIGKLTKEMLWALKEKDFNKMKTIINLTQKNLTELGVSCKEIEKISKAVESIGGAAKLCGAGGGGVMLCYHKDKKKLIKTIRALGFNPWESELGVEGVRIEI
jgi:mevalonate kinase